MAMFNFDSETNVINNRTPSLKAINKNFCKKKGAAGLWIANDNIEACGWKKNCQDDCESDCSDHYVNTAQHIVQGAEDEIEGRGILNTRMLILRRTKLIRLTDKGQFSGFWVKGDGEIKDETGKKKYTCARRYLVFFVDEQNNTLHTDPIQLTAKGTFMVNFDQEYMKFRTDMSKAYCKSMKRRFSTMNDLWYAMCVFVPTFESKLVGKTGFQSYACAVKSYEVPTEDNWLTMCVGRNVIVNEFINLAFIESEKWINKFEKSLADEFDDAVSIFSSGSK